MRSHAGRGQCASSAEIHGDYRSSQTGIAGNHDTGVFQKSAGGMYCYDYLSDVSGAAGGDSAGDRGTALCSAILSDTLIFRSPTCTEMDRAAARMAGR